MSKNILIIDDNKMNIVVTEHALKNEYNVFSATSGAAGLTIMLQNQIDLVILDVEMPTLRGPEVLEKIRTNNDWDNVKVMYLTASEQFDGGDVVTLIKPLEPARLLHEVHSILGN